MTRATRLSAEEREQEARDVLARKDEFEGRSGFLNLVQNMVRWDIQWRAKMERENPPWLHASSYNPPLTTSKSEDLHAILYGYTSSFDFFSIAAASKKGYASEVMEKRARDWTDLIRWSLQNETNASGFLDGFVHDGVVFGSGYGRLSWMHLARNIQTEFPLPKTAAGDGRMTDLSLIRAVLGPNLRSRPKQMAGKWAFKMVDDDGEEKDVTAWVDRETPHRPKGTPVVVVEREVVYYDAPRPRLVSPWNIMIPPTARDLQTCRRYWERDFMDFGEILQATRSGIFNLIDPEEIDELREMSERKPIPTMSGSEARDAVEFQRDSDIGQSLIEARAEASEICYEYSFEDIDGDGIDESIVRAVLVGRVPVLAMRQRVEYLYPHGRRPHFDWHLWPVRGRYYGMGVPELLEGAQIEENAYYQSRSDVLEIITKPGGLYDPLSGLAPDEISYRPGMFIKVRDPQTALREFNFPTDPSLLLREQSGIEMQAERVIGSTDMGIGRGPSRPNAPRTLGGTAIMVRQQQLRTNVFLRRLLVGSGECPGGISEFLLQYHGLMAALMPETKEFRAAGSNELRTASRAELQGRFDFIVDFGEEINNPQLRMQNAALRLQYAERSPIIAQNPMALWDITVDFFEATGMRNARQHIPSPQGAGDHPPLPQVDEFLIMSKGIRIEPLLTDNHQAHLAEIAGLLQDTIRLASHFTPQTLPLLEDHAQKHLRMLTASAQAAPAGGFPGFPSGGGGPPGAGRAPRVQAAMGGPVAMREPMAGPIESEMERGLTP